MTQELRIQFGKYVLLELVGRGATAAVYRAVQSGAMGFRKEVAIKKVLSTVVDRERVLKRLINEARVSGYLHHRNLVEVYEFDRVDEAYYLAMEFVGGPSLHEILLRIPRQGPLPGPIIAGILLQICDGLAYAHRAVDEMGQPMNLVHRDIKPGNVMLTYDGLVKITDFGVAKATTNLFHTRAANITRGTPIYMSPEQVRGLRLDARSDIFSLGSLAVEMVTGSAMFQDTHLYRVLSKVDQADVTRPLEQVEGVVPGLAPVLRQALERDPRARFPSAMAMAQALRLAIAPITTQADLAVWLREWLGVSAERQEGPEDTADEAASEGISGPVAELDLTVPSVEDTGSPTPLRQDAAEADRGRGSGAGEGAGEEGRVTPLSITVEPMTDELDLDPGTDPEMSTAVEPDADEGPAYLARGDTPTGSHGPAPPLFADRGDGPLPIPEYLVAQIEAREALAADEADLSLAELDLGDAVDREETTLGTPGDPEADLISAGPDTEIVSTGPETDTTPTVEEGEVDDQAEVATAVDLPVPPLDPARAPGSPDVVGESPPPGEGGATDTDDDLPTLDDEEEPPTTSGLPVSLAPVEAGSHWMGSAEIEVGRDADEELHEVQVTRPFLVGRVPVTQGQWSEVMGDPGTSDARDLPMAGVTWFDAIDFCVRLSEQEDLAPAYRFAGEKVLWDRDAPGYRLLTEAEWELAARAGEYTRFAGSDHADDVAWHRGNSGEQLQGVAGKRPNRLGLYDMCGNVSEWVWDRYGPYRTGAAETDPTGPDEGEFRIQRGGSVLSPAADVRCARRHIDGRPDESRPHVGFRLARNLD